MTIDAPRFDEIRRNGLMAGVDEVGRGPLAGPVVAAAVVLDPARPIDGLRDSKALSAARRRELAGEIRCRALAFAIGFSSVEEIDAINILRASLLAMQRAVSRLRVRPLFIAVDGNQLPQFAGDCERVRAEAVVGGDRIVAEISAASILAKVCRDRLLMRLHRRWPDYGFARNKGYPTAEHLDALGRVGPCPIHRRSFAPVRRLLDEVAS